MSNTVNNSTTSGVFFDASNPPSVQKTDPTSQKIQSLAHSSDPNDLQNYFKDEYKQYASNHGGENPKSGLDFAKEQEQPLLDSGTLLKDPTLAKKFDDALAAVLPQGYLQANKT